MNEEEKKESAITETAGAGMQTLPETAPAIAEKRIYCKVQGVVEQIFRTAPQGQQAHLAVYQIFCFLQRRDDLSIPGIYLFALCIRAGNGKDRMDMAGDRAAVGREMDDHRVCARV